MNTFKANGMDVTLLYGVDVLEGLSKIADSSVHVCCTSPPYWGLRDYGTGDAQIGGEVTLDEYIQKLVYLFDQIRRVLRRDGTVWLNLGDSYVGGGGHCASAPSSAHSISGKYGVALKPGGIKPQGILKAKDLAGVPWRVALALQEQGWYLRQDIIWRKPNVFPESVTDRCTRSHEYLFLLAHPDSGGTYYFDHDAIKEPTTKNNQSDPSMRNKRSVWSVHTKPYTGAHFATWPPELVRSMILAGTSSGCCSICGDPQMCSCPDRTTVPCTVLDPFSGSGTTGQVAVEEGRQYIGIDLNAEYEPLAEKRILGYDPKALAEDLAVWDDIF